jgi:2',3'-cyclic-nucleotide 2'-phosphodiesterase (5'-nucleotidase family)
MPFGGGIREVDIKGNLLLQVLEAGLKNTGTGGYLQHQPVSYTASSKLWSINNAALDTNRIYRVAMSDFLLTGKEASLDFLNTGNPGILKVYDAETATNNPKSDLRLAVVQYLTK